LTSDRNAAEMSAAITVLTHGVGQGRWSCW
jgi:hypothetical protein